MSIDVTYSALDLNAKKGKKQIINISETEFYELLLT